MKLPSWVSLKNVGVAVIWTAICVGGGYAIKAATTASANELLGTTFRIQNDPYSLVDPLLGCTTGSTVPTPSLNELQNRLQNLVDMATHDGMLAGASIYVRDMIPGTWTGVNPDTTYEPASLLKVPVLITYLKQAEYNPDLLSYTVTITEDPAENTVQDIPPPESVQAGETYSINDLLELMVVDSDNRALNVLMQYIDINVLRQSFSDLGVVFPEDDVTYEISPRTYSRFFRILYNATYLSAKSSQRALFLLSKSTFTNGIRAGVPDDIKVAHKFGEAPVTLPSGEQGHELHDCGMVYTDQPYALCVMTTGKDVDALTAFLKTVSEVTYEELNTVTP